MEALFGIIVTLTFTSSLSVATAGQQEVREMWMGALGCNLAWGVVDACFFLMGALTEQGRRLRLVQRLRASSDDTVISHAFSEVMPERVVALMTPAERSALGARVARMPDPPKITLTGADLMSALGVLLWVFLITLPVVLPFFFIQNAVLALRVSNAIAILLLAFIGWRIALYSGFNMIRTIVYLVLFGILMVAITIALGG